MDKLIPEKAQGKEVVQFISYPVECRLEIETISILTHATIVRKRCLLLICVYSRATVRKHHHKLVRLLVNVYCKHALIIESTRDVWAVKNVTVTSILTNCKCLFFIIMYNDLVMHKKRHKRRQFKINCSKYDT
jgi:hypothetical protein